MDWNNHRTSDTAVMCRITVRHEYNGCPAKPEAAALNGQVMKLAALWLMDDEDPYPGEWALGTSGLLKSSGIGWIASGDVQPIEAHASTPPAESSVAADSSERGV